MTPRSFIHQEIPLWKLGGFDLQEEAVLTMKNGLESSEHRIPEIHAYEITIWEYPYTCKATILPNKATALYIPYEGRLGIEWGSDATWADVEDVEKGIEMWLNNLEAQEEEN